jgi:ABC-type bacteriocin/lantibiotic exporter with double-glycine peptidase domain
LYKNVIIKVNVFGILPRYFLEIIIVTILVITIFILNYSTINEKDILVTLGIYSVVLFRLFPATNKIITNLQQLTGGAPIINIVYNDFDKLRKNKNNKKLFQLDRIDFKNKIEIKNLNFKYQIKNKKNLLSDINLEIDKGSSVGVFGPSGSGKSTLMNIFLGLIKQNYGEIIVDGFIINNFNPYWKELIGYVPQDINLINDNIQNNITLDLDSYYDQERMQEALKISKLDDFVNNLPKGLKYPNWGFW